MNRQNDIDTLRRQLGELPVRASAIRANHNAQNTALNERLEALLAKNGILEEARAIENERQGLAARTQEQLQALNQDQQRWQAAVAVLQELQTSQASRVPQIVKLQTEVEPEPESAAPATETEEAPPQVVGEDPTPEAPPPAP